jgi:hypothetical protein
MGIARELEEGKSMFGKLGPAKPKPRTAASAVPPKMEQLETGRDSPTNVTPLLSDFGEEPVPPSTVVPVDIQLEEDIAGPNRVMGLTAGVQRANPEVMEQDLPVH